MAHSTKEIEETIGIDSSGNAVSIIPAGRDTLTLHITEDASATYQIDGRVRGGTWRENIGPNGEYSGGGPHHDTVTITGGELRIRCSSGTGGSNDEATISLMMGG